MFRNVLLLLLLAAPALSVHMEVAVSAAKEHSLRQKLAHRMQTEHQLKVHKRQLRQAATQGNAALDKARKVLNTMFDETQDELDLTLIDCHGFKVETVYELDQNTMDRAQLGKQVADARESISLSQGKLEEAQQQIEQLDQSLEQHRTVCATAAKTAQDQLKLLMADLAVANTVVGMTKCKPALIQMETSTAKAPTSLMQCIDSDGESFITFGEHHTRVLAASLQTDMAHKALQGALKTSMPRRMSVNAAGMSLVQTGTSTSDEWDGADEDEDEATDAEDKSTADSDVEDSPANGADKFTQSALAQSDDDDDEEDSSSEAMKDAKDASLLAKATLMQRSRVLLGKVNDTAPVSDEPDADKQKARCSINNSPNCPKFADAMFTMVGQLSDAKDEMEHNMQLQQQKCQTIEGDYEAQLTEWREMLNSENVMLADATKSLNEDEEETRLKHEEYVQLDSSLTTKMSECRQKVSEAGETLCGVRKIRKELYKMEGERPFIQDCEVSDWQSAPCSVSCGGGVQTLIRNVVTSAKLGAACPPLKMQQACNQHKCPIDCKLASWSGWSKCSKDCGGGVQQRVRHMVQEPLHGGQPCEETQEERLCNTQSCDRDCVLHSWSRWSGCTKACGGGLQFRKRYMRRPARGSGRCPAKRSRTRFGWKRCNRRHCPVKVKCNSKVDIVMLLDSSGSVGAKGFAATKEFAKRMVSAFELGEDKAQMGIITFSSAITIVSPLTSDKAALEAATGTLTWAMGSTDTAGALAETSTVLLEGRKSAQSVAFVVTDGMPNNKWRTGIAAWRLRRQGIRVVFVAVGRYLKMKMLRRWASRPSFNNIISVRKFGALDSYMGKMITSLCPIIKTP